MPGGTTPRERRLEGDPVERILGDSVERISQPLYERLILVAASKSVPSPLESGHGPVESLSS